MNPFSYANEAQSFAHGFIGIKAFAIITNSQADIISLNGFVLGNQINTDFMGFGMTGYIS